MSSCAHSIIILHHHNMYRRPFQLLLLLASLACVFLQQQARGEELLVNNDFATGDLTGWTVVGNTDYFSVTGGVLAMGTVGSSSSISQTVTTSANDTYELSFTLSNDGGTPNSFLASVDGQTLLSLTDASAFSATQYSYNVVASSGSAVVTFSAQQDPAYYYLSNTSFSGQAPSVSPSPSNSPSQSSSPSASPSTSVTPSSTPSPSPSSPAPVEPSAASKHGNLIAGLTGKYPPLTIHAISGHHIHNELFAGLGGLILLGVCVAV
jgi:hypothetical protein